MRVPMLSLRFLGRQQPERAQYQPLELREYEVRLVELPKPPESAMAAPITVKAAGPIDAVLAAGPLFNEVLASRKVRPLAQLRVYRGGIAVQLFKAHEKPVFLGEPDPTPNF